MNLSGSSNHPITVDILTPAYRIVGKILITRTGLIGVMTDTNNSVIDVHDAQLARLHVPTKLANRFQVGQVVKNQVTAVCVTRREDLGPMVLGAYNNPVTQYPVHIMTTDFEIDGEVEWHGRFDFGALMGQGFSEYVPLYKAVITAILNPAVRIESPAILVNRRFIDMVALTSTRKTGEL